MIRKTNARPCRSKIMIRRRKPLFNLRILLSQVFSVDVVVVVVVGRVVETYIEIGIKDDIICTQVSISLFYSSLTCSSFMTTSVSSILIAAFSPSLSFLMVILSAETFVDSVERPSEASLPQTLHLH